MAHSQNESDRISKPIVSIGLPVFNRENCIKNAIQSIINQTFKDWELIISDNNSTDNTIKIIEKFLSQDNRIFLFKQKKNIGMYPNFDFVLKKSSGRYFHWLASDDTRSLNFLEDNISYLENNHDYIASCSLKYFGSVSKFQKNNKNFKIDQETEHKRINMLLDNIWQSHSIFCSVIRTNVIKKCQYLGEHYLAQDWTINSFLAKNGKIALQNNSHIIIGENGVSKTNPFKPFRLFWIEYFIPLYSFHKRFSIIISNLNFVDKKKLEIKIISLHLFTMRILFINFVKKIIKIFFKDNLKIIK